MKSSRRIAVGRKIPISNFSFFPSVSDVTRCLFIPSPGSAADVLLDVYLFYSNLFPHILFFSLFLPPFVSVCRLVDIPLLL